MIENTTATLAPVVSTKRQKNNYIDNKKFLEAMIDYKKYTNAAKAKGLTKKDDKWPRCPDYIGDCFMKIATHLSYRMNFIGYSFKEDMVSDGVENCLMYVDNFNPDKYKNPFAYFTQIIFFAFIRRIEREKKQVLIKYKIIENLDLTEILADGDDAEATSQLVEFLKEQLDKVDADKRAPKVVKVKKVKVEKPAKPVKVKKEKVAKVIKKKKVK